MKKILIITSLFFFILSCKNNSGLTNVEKNNSIDNDSIEILDERIQTIEEFYLSVYGSDNLNNLEVLKRKFISDKLLYVIDSLTSDGENLILDYDPFINGQDYIADTIKKTLKITPLKNENEYRVSFLLFGDKNEKITNIDLLLKKDNKTNNFQIYSILNDEHLNLFNVDKKIIQDKTFNIESCWKINCDSYFKFCPSNNNTFIFEVMSNQIYIKSKIEKNKIKDTYSMYLIEPDDLGRGGMQLDWDNFSTNKPIANIKVLSNNTIEFLWLGFYNNEIEKYEFTECEFTINSESNLSILRRCD